MLPLSFRARILLLLLAVALVPLALVGFWLTRTAARSGEGLLRTRLAEAMEETTSGITSRWVQQRFDLLFLAEDASLQETLRDGGSSDIPAGVRERFEGLDPGISAVRILNRLGETTWSLTRSGTTEERSTDPGGRVTAAYSIRDRLSGELLGTLAADLRPDVLLPPGSMTPAAAGMVVGLFEPETDVPLLPLPMDPVILTEDRFVWGGEEWLSARREFSEPPFDLVLAAPVTPFVQPFEDAAGRGGRILLFVALSGIALATVVTGRMTRSLRKLAAAAAAVSAGDLEQQVEDPGFDEVGQVARAFNGMTESLRRTLAELATRESLAAVGEFAASLAHEIRNPLTSIRVDLQAVEERVPDEPGLRVRLESVLSEIDRLNLAVENTLEVARRGRASPGSADLWDSLTAAARAARPAFEVREAILTLKPPPAEPIMVRGDAGALEQLFLNVIQNAAQALEAGGEARVGVKREGQTAVVTVQDDGVGIPEEALDQIFDPLFSTRKGGTGLGLTIARRIARTAGGDIQVRSAPGSGTTVTIRLPLASAVGETAL
jgi:signal transduction histidine kinase